MKLDELKQGYFKNSTEQIYYKCLNNCEICENASECIQCKSGFKLYESGIFCEEESNNKNNVYIVVLSMIVV